MAERHIETSIDIDAPPQRVWALLTDFAGMPKWNPFIKSITGRLATGSRLAVYIVPPGKAGMTFHPTILTANPGRELRWLGHFLVPGIFDGEHYFLITPVGGSGSRLTQGEKFAGILVGLFGSTLSATEIGFQAMNAALKKTAEGRED
jgi:hypothetical protein